MAQAHWTYGYQQAKARLRARRLPDCVLCQGHRGPIRYDLGYPHPLSFSAEHVIPVHIGGGSGPLAPAHLGCQRRQGAAITNTRRRHARPMPLTSKRWG